MNLKQLLSNSIIGLMALVFSTSLWAHGGAAGTDTDQCKFELEPDHWIHYTAYQPKAFPAEEFCGSLPSADTLTQLVFDYQDIRYRNMTVEFEVTKEPEGTVVFNLPKKKHKSGTIVLSLPNGVPEPGKYLIHITLIPDEGEGKRLDVHMGFIAGGGKGVSRNEMLLYAFLLFAVLYVVYLSHAGFKAKVDEIISKIKS
jgi:hypothetical protein